MIEAVSETSIEAASENSALVPWHRDSERALGFVEYGYDTRSEYLEKSIEEALGGLGQPTKSGIIVTAEQAMMVSAAYACRRVISEDIAKLPRRVVKETTDPETGRMRSETQHLHPVHKLLNSAPNEWMTPFELVQYMVWVATGHEGAYALVQRNDKGIAEEILPLLPGCCSTNTDAWWRVTYHITGYGKALQRDPSQMLRINGPLDDPWRGHSSLSLSREAVALAAAIEGSQARFHANDLRPSGILTTEETIKEEQRDAIRAAWRAAYGQGGQGGVAVLDKKFKFEAITLEGAKSEVVENRKFQISDICRFFRVFPTVIGHNDGSQTFASVEAMFTAHAVHTLQPWTERVEEAMTLGLLTQAERDSGLRVDLDMDHILRGTPSERATYYERATKVFLTPNEARIREGLDPLADPNMNRVQLAANNTGLFPSVAPATDAKPVKKPAPVSTSTPVLADPEA